MDIVLFGIQGSGKGTQGKILAEKFQFKIFETGAELRKLSKIDSDLGKKVKVILEAGRLVPNEIVMEIVEHFLQTLPPGAAAIFDGVPRSLPQAQSFEALMKKWGRSFQPVLIDLPREKAEERLLARRLCEGCKALYSILGNNKKDRCDSCGGKLVVRSDDTPDAIRQRLDLFLEETMPVVSRYQKEENLITVNGGEQAEETSSRLMQSLRGTPGAL